MSQVERARGNKRRRRAEPRGRRAEPRGAAYGAEPRPSYAEQPRALPRPEPRSRTRPEPYKRPPAAPAPQGTEKTAMQPVLVRRGVDIALLVTVSILVVLGLVMVLSASYYEGEASGEGGMAVFFQQLFGAAVGLGVMITLMQIRFTIYNNKLVIGMAVAVSFALLVLVLIPGVGIYRNGSRRWLPVLGRTFQPSELAKVTLVMFNAWFMSHRQGKGYNFISFMLPVLVMGGSMFGLIMLQPNLSTGASLLISVIVMLWMGGAKIRHLVILGSIAAAGVVVLIFTASYRLARFMSFLDPWSMASDDGYQLIQSLLGIASGGLFGRGLGMSNQKLLYLPYAESDFIFAIIGEEVGFVGSVALMGCFFALVFFGMRIAMNCPDRFGSLIAGGISSLFAMQVIINIAVVTGSMPPTGLPLPFFSAGGTSLAIVMASCGMLLGISRYSHKPKARR